MTRLTYCRKQKGPVLSFVREKKKKGKGKYSHSAELLDVARELGRFALVSPVFSTASTIPTAAPKPQARGHIAKVPCDGVGYSRESFGKGTPL